MLIAKCVFPNANYNACPGSGIFVCLTIEEVDKMLTLIDIYLQNNDLEAAKLMSWISEPICVYLVTYSG